MSELGARPFKLSREERRQIFAGTLKVLRRKKKPDQEPGTAIVISWTRGGKQILSRKTGETIEYPRLPRLWIVIKGWHLKQGQTEWETAVMIHDHREQNRQLARGLGGLPRETGLKTRWNESVDSEGVARPRKPRSREEQREHWTSETERGYGGGGGRGLDEERSAEGDIVPATAVDDAVLDDFARRVEEENELKRNRHRRLDQEKLRLESRLAETRQRGMTGASAKVERHLQSVEQGLAAHEQDAA